MIFGIVILLVKLIIGYFLLCIALYILRAIFLVAAYILLWPFVAIASVLAASSNTFIHKFGKRINNKLNKIIDSLDSDSTVATSV